MCVCVLRAHVCASPRREQGPIFFFAFLVQFNSCPNLLSNYANEFIVGGSPSWLSRDLDSLGKGTKSFLSSCLAVWEVEPGRERQRKRGSREGGEKERERKKTSHLMEKEQPVAVSNSADTDDLSLPVGDISVWNRRTGLLMWYKDRESPHMEWGGADGWSKQTLEIPPRRLRFASHVKPKQY